MSKLSRKQKKMLRRIILAAVLLILIKLLPNIPIPAALSFLADHSINGEGEPYLSLWPCT